jgi:hypothetical protein
MSKTRSMMTHTSDVGSHTQWRPPKRHERSLTTTRASRSQTSLVWVQYLPKDIIMRICRLLCVSILLAPSEPTQLTIIVCGTFVLTYTTAPRSVKMSTSGEFFSDIRPKNDTKPMVASEPSTSKQSLRLIGRPWRGPTIRPFSRSLSRKRARS